MSSPGPAEIEVEHLDHFYRKDKQPFQVLQDISFAIAENEFVSIIGPSGCGKSTLLFIIAGFIRPTAGLARHEGAEITGPSSRRGVVFQADAVFPWMTVYENIAFGPRVKALSRADYYETVVKYIKLVGLEGFENLYPKQLSGGMKKRVDVARTLACDPDVLLMDEPFGSLDHQTKESMQLELLNLWEGERKTAVFVTHDIEEAIFLADRVLVMSRRPGRIDEIITVPFGRPREAELKVTGDFQRLRYELMKKLASL